MAELRGYKCDGCDKIYTDKQEPYLSIETTENDITTSKKLSFREGVKHACCDECARKIFGKELMHFFSKDKAEEKNPDVAESDENVSRKGI